MTLITARSVFVFLYLSISNIRLKFAERQGEEKVKPSLLAMVKTTDKIRRM